MYNLIGNTCCASWITQQILHQEFINPICWSVIDFESAFNLVSHFYDINWIKINLQTDDTLSNFSLCVDGTITINYVHYKFEANANELYKQGDDVYFNRIWEYIIEKYISRIQKMCQLHIAPRFIFTTPKEYRDARTYYSLDEQYKLANLKTDYPMIFSFPTTISHPNVISIHQDTVFSGNSLSFSKYIYSKIPPQWWN